jgi:hypothetical protein
LRLEICVVAAPNGKTVSARRRNQTRETRALPNTAKLPRHPYFSLLSISCVWHDPDREVHMMDTGEPENGKRFVPSGAIFFFALLILFYAALWLVIYWIMIARA